MSSEGFELLHKHFNCGKPHNLKTSTFHVDWPMLQQAAIGMCLDLVALCAGPGAKGTNLLWSSVVGSGTESLLLVDTGHYSTWYSLLLSLHADLSKSVLGPKSRK